MFAASGRGGGGIVDSRKEAIWGEEVQMLMVQVSVEYTSRGMGYRIR